MQSQIANISFGMLNVFFLINADVSRQVKQVHGKFSSLQLVEMVPSAMLIIAVRRRGWSKSQSWHVSATEIEYMWCSHVIHRAGIRRDGPVLTPRSFLPRLQHPGVCGHPGDWLVMGGAVALETCVHQKWWFIRIFKVGVENQMPRTCIMGMKPGWCLPGVRGNWFLSSVPGRRPAAAEDSRGSRSGPAVPARCPSKPSLF